MFPKLVILTLIIVVLSASLLMLRQRRLELANQLAVMHAQMTQTRQQLWQSQADVAARITPQSLQQSISEAELVMEPQRRAPSGADTRWVRGEPPQPVPFRFSFGPE